VDESEADDLDGLNVFVRNRHGHGHASHGNNGGNDGNGNSNNNSNNARPAASARHQSLDDYAIETSHDGQPSGSHVSASPQTHASHTNHGHNNHGHSHSPSHAQLQPQAPSRWHSIGSGNARSTVRHRSPTAPGPAPPQPSMGTAGAGFAGSGAATSSVSGISPSTLQGLGIMSSEHHSSSLNNTTAAANGRRRAQSLMSPVDNTPSTPSSARRSRFRPALGSPLSARRVSSSSGIPSNNGLLPSPLSSRKASDSHLHSRAGSTRSIGTVHEQQQFDPRLNGNGNGHGHGQGRAPSREGSIRQQQQQQQHQQQRDSPAARKQRAFGNSLGLGAAPREAALSPDQIQDLLADFDVSIAIQRMNAPIATRRVSTIQPAHTPRDRSPSRHASAEAPPKAGAAAGTPAEESPQPFTKPYLVSAPPALTSGDWHGRDRTVSVSSSIAPTRTFSPQSSLLRPPSASFDAESEERERAANAVGFTAHGVSPIPAVDSEAENENADPFGFERAVTAADTSAAAQPPPLSASTRADSKSSMPVSRPIPTLVDSTASAASAASAATAATVATTALASSTATQSPAKTDKDKDGGRRRISGLFGLRRSKHGVSSPAPTPAPSTPPPAAPAQLLKSSASPAPTPPRLTREQEMRIAEQERRGQEMVQGKLSH
jgi:hypothetical protein